MRTIFQSYGTFDYNFNLGPNSAIRFMAHADKLDGDRDFMDGDRFGFNPTLRVKLSPRTTMDISYENIDHERFIDRGIPTGTDGRPQEELSDVVFGTKAINYHTVEADIFRINFESELSATLKSNFVLSHSQFDKVYQNVYANGYSESDNEVELKGYSDPTGRDSLIASYSLIKEFGDHTLLFGAEYVDQENTNHRYDLTLLIVSSVLNKRQLGLILHDQVHSMLVQQLPEEQKQLILLLSSPLG